MERPKWFSTDYVTGASPTMWNYSKIGSAIVRVSGVRKQMAGGGGTVPKILWLSPKAR